MHKDPKFRKVLKEMLECYQQQGLMMDPLPKLRFVADPQHGSDIYGATGYYDPKTMTIVVYTMNRHPKDVLRSLSHELIHHDQNLNGMFNTPEAISEDPAYAQTNPYLRKMEEDANLRGNMMFRDFTDQQKYSKA